VRPRIFLRTLWLALALSLGLALSLSSSPSSAPPPVPTPEQQAEVVKLDTERMAQISKNDFAGAIATAQKLWALKKKIYGAEADEADQYKQALAETLDMGMRYTESLELFRQLEAKAIAKHGAESKEVAAVLQRMESVLNTVQRFEELETVYQRVLAIKKKLDGENSLAYAAELGTYASFLAARTQYSAAQRLLEQQIKIWEQVTGGKPDANLATSLLHLGRIYWETQQQAKATAAFDRGLDMMDRAPYALSWATATTMVSVAMSYRLGGRAELAAPLEKRAKERYIAEIARMEKTKADDPMFTNVLGFYGQMLSWTDDLAGAEQQLTRAVETDRRLNRNSAWTAPLANIKRMAGKPQDAIPLLQRASADIMKLAGRKNVYSSMLADVYADLGDYKQAQAALNEDLARIEKFNGKKSSDYSLGLLRMAINDVRRGSVSDAEPRLVESLDLAERELSTTLKTGTESDHRAWFRRNGYQQDVAISFELDHAQKSAGAVRLALTTLLRRKGRVLDMAAANMATIRAKLSPADQQLLDELAGVRSQLAKLKVAGPSDDVAAYAKQVATLDERIQELEIKISKKSSAYRAISQPIDLASIQKLIPARTKLVEIVNHQPFAFTRKYTPKPQPIPRRYLAYVVGAKGDPLRVELGPAEAIDQAVTAFRKALSKPKSEGVSDLGRALYDLTFAKIAPALDGATDLLIAPDGTLNLVPFAALVDDHREFLIKQFTFTYLTSGRDLLRLNVKTKAQSGGVIFSDPSFDGSAPGESGTSRGTRSVDLSSINWPQLPGTRQEAEQVQKTMKKFKLYAGAQATESQLKQLHGPSILHMATHGFFLKDKSNSGSRGLDASGPVAQPPAEENPLLRAGLVLAGANQLSSGTDDGILTALEATGLDLWGTQLVVLSACQTGDGKVTNGDGVYGLRRALVIAGAEALVMTLWQVDDFATRDLMVGFYRLLHKGSARSSALRDIQLEILQQPKYAHPYYWAAFVPTGENAPIKD